MNELSSLRYDVILYLFRRAHYFVCIINLQGLIVKVRVPDRKVERTEGEGTFNRKGPTEATD